jgi:hypothetical protein
MSDISFVIGKPIGDEYLSIVKSSAEKKGITFDDAWVDYCHEVLGKIIETTGENSLNQILSSAFDKNVIAPKTFLTYRTITANGQARTSPVLMLLSDFCNEQETGKKIQITEKVTEYVSAYIGKTLEAESIAVVLTTPVIDSSIFSDADKWRAHLFEENSYDCLNAFKNAIEKGNDFPVVFLIDVRDEMGGVLAKSLNGGKDIIDFNTYIGTATFETFQKISNILKKNGFDLKVTKPITFDDYRSLVAVIAADGISYFDAHNVI